VAYDEDQDEVFLGMTMGRQRQVSEATAQKIDAEVRRILDEAYATARKILSEKARDHETLAQGLLEYETLTGEEIADLLAGKPPKRDDEDDTTKSTPSVPVTKTKKSGGEEADGMEPQPQS